MLDKGYGPIVLLADSQLLFSQSKGQPLRQWISEKMVVRSETSAFNASRMTRQALYIGASNDNAPEFYDMAVEICKSWGIETVVNGTSVHQFTEILPEDVDLVLLAGGDIERGWAFISQDSVKTWLHDFSALRGVLIGISAGAIHLTSTFSIEHSARVGFLRFRPFGVVVHEEAQHWPTAVAWHQHQLSGDEYGLFGEIYCIPFGGGMVVEDEKPEPVGKGFFLSES